MEHEIHDLSENDLVRPIGHEWDDLAAMCPEGMLRQHRLNHPGGHERIDAPELTALHPAPDDASQEADVAHDRLLDEEAHEGGKVVQLADGEAIHDLEVPGEQVLPGAPHVVPELLGAAAVRELALGALDGGDHRLADHLLEQRFLVGEVEVDGALRDAGAHRDIVEPGAREPALAEDLDGGVEDLARALLGEAAPARRGGSGRGSGQRAFLAVSGQSSTGDGSRRDRDMRHEGDGSN